MKKIIGMNPIIEALDSGKSFEKIEIYTGIKKESIKKLLKIASTNNIKINYTNKRFDNSQGIVGYLLEYDYYTTLEAFLEKELIHDESLIVILDQIQDPGNFGAIIRSCECFGVRGIIIQDRNNVKVTETVIKSSAGAIEHMDIVQVVNISDTIDKLKKYGYFVYAAAGEGDKQYDKIEYAKKKVLVVGNEGNGIRKKVREHSDMIVKIPLLGKINSLNVSVATGIIIQDRNNVKVTETVIKSSAGAIEHMDIVQVVNISDTIDKLKKYGYFVYAAAGEGDKQYDKIEYAKKKVLVVGNEGNGIRKKVREHSDMIVKIPLLGKINSLNVSVATGIFLAKMQEEQNEVK